MNVVPKPISDYSSVVRIYYTFILRFTVADADVLLLFPSFLIVNSRNIYFLPLSRCIIPNSIVYDTSIFNVICLHHLHWIALVQHLYGISCVLCCVSAVHGKYFGIVLDYLLYWYLLFFIPEKSRANVDSNNFHFVLFDLML